MRFILCEEVHFVTFTFGRCCLKRHFCHKNNICLFMLQRVNPLVSNKLQNINRRIYPSEQQKKESVSTFETPSFIFNDLKN